MIQTWVTWVQIEAIQEESASDENKHLIGSVERNERRTR